MKEACEKRTTNILDISGKKYAFDSTRFPLVFSYFQDSMVGDNQVIYRGRSHTHVTYYIRIAFYGKRQFF